METIAQKVIEGLSSLTLEEFNLLRDLRDDKKRMEETVSAIKATLLDAEANATSHQVDDWLEKLKDVLYDADDLLDDFSTESLARKVMNAGKPAKQVRTFFSKSNQVAYAHKMSRKMKNIRKKLDHIADDKKKLEFVTCSPKPPIGVKEQRQTYSFVHKEEIIGREEENNVLKSILLNTNLNQDVSIITIVGFGGLGKTALAQLVYNDVAVQSYFELKMWVCVSDPFDIREIGQKMVVDCEKDANIQQVQEKVRDKIKGRRYLLILDDVWNENRNLWLKLKSLLMEGGKGSMVIVTTRISKVKKIMDADFSLDLKGLDDDRSWKLFSRMAFEDGKEPNIPELVTIGKEIAKKCVGIPLALKTIGSLLYTRELTKNDWLYFKNSELLEIDQENNDILPILKLSYDHLSPNLKNCFIYCSLFPKDYEIIREILIQLWMAQGFIPLSDQGRCPEDVGHEYFMNLLSRSFFQDVESDDFGNIIRCKMHDLMHDLASWMSANECMVVKEANRENIGDRIRHLSFDHRTLEPSWKPPISLLETSKLRTFLVPCYEVGNYNEFSPKAWVVFFCCYWSCYFSPEALANFFCCHWRWNYAELYRFVSVINSLISNKKSMRVLDLQGLDTPIIPKTIQKLKHLRYLDLSDNKLIRKLPKGITKLHNLQTLKLNSCWNLTELPRDINKLVSLRHLELDGCSHLSGMPHGLRQLTSLQTLSDFYLGPRKSDSAGPKKSDGAGLSELGRLNNLRGHLSIQGLERMRSKVEKVMSAKLLMKQYLLVLNLCWLTGFADVGGKEEVVGKDEMILQGLQPHPTIKALRIEGFCGSKLPDWIGYLSSLQSLDIIDCEALASLPECIRNLSSLEFLYINGCKVLTSLPESIGQLPLLQGLSISHCIGLTSLPEGIQNLRSLQVLSIHDCPSLKV